MKEKKPRSAKQLIMGGLGKAWMWWPPRNEVKRRCRVDGKPGWYRCELCKAERERIDIDHIKPIVSVEGFTSWDDYIRSRFVDATNLQGICKDCHKKKTQAENKKRREAKKKLKEPK